MAIEIKVKLKSRALVGWQARLKRAKAVVQDLEPTFEAIYHPFLLMHMRDQFASSGAAGGSRWADLSAEPRYAAYKRSIVGNVPVLRWPTAREQLYPSLATRGPSHIERSSERAARFGTDVPHARTLERGGVGPFGERYPARKILVLGTNRSAELYSLLKQDVMARIERTRRPVIKQ